MAYTNFVAFASGNEFHTNIFNQAAKSASTNNYVVKPWSDEDPNGTAISSSVEHWIEDANFFTGDLSKPNHNVTYEIGYAIGLGKPIRLIRSSHFHFEPVRNIGLFDTLAHDTYDLATTLARLLKKDQPNNPWKASPRNKDQPLFIVLPPLPMEWSRKTVSAVKKVARLKFRNFNPAEISRLNAREAFEHASSSYGVIIFWQDEQSEVAFKHNQRSCFLYGIARGLGIPCMLLAHHTSKLPLDIHDSATRWDRLEQIDAIIADFRDDVLDEMNNYVDQALNSDPSLLKRLNFGDPVAENEQAHLSEFFLETDPYFQSMNGTAHILIGRKGSGKSAIFLQVRDRCRSNKQNIVIDLMPEGFHLIKFKEFILENISYGSRKEVIAAFWEYVLWLEIAYKLLEKDQHASRRDPQVLERYMQLERLFNARVDTGIGDFSERLRLLADNIIERYKLKHKINGLQDYLKSSEVLEIIYGNDLRELRESVSKYLKIKGYVLFLFDNLDRIWTPGGFDDSDALILIGLAEAMQEISRKFSKNEQDFRWSIFIRSDVYEFLVAGMADYGKLSTASLEWTDREQLKTLFNFRLHAQDTHRPIQLSQISDMVVNGVPVIDFLIDKSMMRPRYLIRLFETARRRAMTLSRGQIIEDDYEKALIELGWQVLEDIDREISDLVPDGTAFLFEMLSHKDDLYPDKIRYLANARVPSSEVAEKLIDVLIWSGAIGVCENGSTRYIFDCGYRRQYLRAVINANASIKLSVHPTLCSTLA